MPTRFWPVSAGRAFVGRLEPGSDLIDEIERHCAEQGITAAQVSVVGAVRRARYGYYEQERRGYRELETDTHHEITGFVGNISLREGKPFLHAHATFSNGGGVTVGGHLLRGIEVFVAEVMIRELSGVALVRQHDEETGLALW
jgi:uncharacterized protein